MAGQADLKVVITAIDRTSAQIAAVQAKLDGLGRTTRGGTVAADAFNRASTRTLAALGAISPTAATAAAQMTALTGATGALTLALGAAVVVTAVGAVSFFKLAKAASESQDIQAQTNAVLASTKNISGLAATNISALADQLSRVIPIDDELIQKTENLLLTFTQIRGDIFKEATEAALDMAIALKKDPTEAAILLGKALQSPLLGVRALQLAGVRLSAAQKQQVIDFLAVNDVASAQRVILHELNVEFGNSGRAAGTTLSGQLKILQTQIGNVEEAIGARLLPKLLAGTTALGNFVGRHQAGIDRLTDKVSKFFGLMSSGVGVIVAGAGKLRGIFRPFTEFVDEHPAVLAALAAVGAALYATALAFASPFIALGFLKENWGDVFDGLPEPVQSAAISVAGVLDTMANAVIGALNAVLGAVESFINKMLSKLTGGGLGRLISKGLDKLGLPGLPTSVSLGQIGVPGNLADALKGLQHGPVLGPPSPPKTGGVVPFIPAENIDDLGNAAGGAAEKIEKLLTVEDALKDGIIDLTEAMTLGLSKNDVIVLELVHNLDELAAAAFRTDVELGKMFLLLQDAGTSVRAGAELVRQGDLAFGQATLDTRAQLVALSVLTGRNGLTSQVGIFNHALTDLGEGFRAAGETVVAFLGRLSRAALDATQSAFDALFNRPTREQATANLRLAELNRQRLLLLQGGRPSDDPMIKALDDEIAKVQAANDLRQSEIDIMKARADLADRTLLSDRNQLIQINLLIGAIGQQSALVNQLNGALFFEQLARLAAIGQLDAFTRALAGATTALASGAAHGARTAGLLGAGLAGANIAVHVTAPASQQEIVRTVERELNRQLTRASLGGSPPVTGSFVPG